ncbi:MAG: hypothetical protein ACHP7N_12385 [Caulobacterales bacterium]
MTTKLTKDTKAVQINWRAGIFFVPFVNLVVHLPLALAWVPAFAGMSGVGGMAWSDG